MKHQLAGAVFLCLLTMLFFTACTNDSTTNSQLSIDQRLQKVLNDGLHTYGGKGISVTVIFPDGYTWKGAAGISHGTVPITTETLFSAGSITKSFTAVAIIKMVEDGTITLDDSLEQWLDPYPNIDGKITIRQLLIHTSGIYNVTEHPQLWPDLFSDRQRIWTADEILTNYVLEPYFSRGTQWHYSNTGYIILRKLIAELTGSTIAEFYRTRIFDPAGLNDSYLYPEEILPGAVAHGWFDVDGFNGYDDISIEPPISFYSAAGGGVFATATDLAFWVKKIFVDGHVVTQDQLSEMTKFYTSIQDEILLSGYGLGLVQFNPELFNNLTVFGHSGDAPGYAAGSFYLPDYGVCIGIATNTEEGETMYVINDLLTLITEHIEEIE